MTPEQQARKDRLCAALDDLTPDRLDWLLRCEAAIKAIAGQMSGVQGQWQEGNPMSEDDFMRARALYLSFGIGGITQLEATKKLAWLLRCEAAIKRLAEQQPAWDKESPPPTVQQFVAGILDESGDGKRASR